MSGVFLTEAQFSIMERLWESESPLRFSARRRAAIRKLDEIGYVSWEFEISPNCRRPKLVYVTSLT